jgi:hypothetical protein
MTVNRDYIEKQCVILFHFVVNNFFRNEFSFKCERPTYIRLSLKRNQFKHRKFWGNVCMYGSMLKTRYFYQKKFPICILHNRARMRIIIFWPSKQMEIPYR